MFQTHAGLCIGTVCCHFQAKFYYHPIRSKERMKGGLTKLIYCEVKDQRVFTVSQGQYHVLLCTSEGVKKG